MEAHDAKRKAGLLTLDNVAEYLHVHPSTIYRMIKRNQLPAFKFGGEWRFNPESLERWRSAGEQNISTAGQTILLGNRDTSAQVTSSRRASASAVRPATQWGSTSEAGRRVWSGWPRLTDP
jgi:excisionase family DNA binding protein